MKKIILICFMILSLNAKSQNIVTTYQYWFDQDYSNAQVGSMTGSLFNPPINATGLSVGMHTFNVRFKQSDSMWSSVITQGFRTGINNLVKFEYWFDQDYAAKILENISLSQLEHINLLSASSNLSPGKHQFYFRTQNSQGKWSSTIGQAFYKSPFDLDSYEFWFDEDYSNKTLITLSTPIHIINIDTLISTNSLSGNAHKISIRAHQTNGLWSTTVSQLLKKPNHIVGYEYWFNNDYATKISQSISPLAELELEPTINASSTPLGSNTVFIRFKDEYGKWSQIITEGFCHNTGDSSIHLKLFIQGYYNGNGMMASVLFNEGVSNDMTITDSIDVELHSSISPYEMLSSIRTSLNTDGTAKCDFPWNFIGSYYLAVKHRNLVETWTSYPIFRGNCPSEYDFTSANTKAFGDNMIEVESGVWAMYSGDINQDQNTDLLDILFLENDINDFQYGYIHTDLNGDGNVDLLDMPSLEGNVNNFVFALHP